MKAIESLPEETKRLQRQTALATRPECHNTHERMDDEDSRVASLARSIPRRIRARSQRRAPSHGRRDAFGAVGRALRLDPSEALHAG